MKTIIKRGVHHRLLEKANERPPKDGEEAAKRWSGLKEKGKLQQLLLNEQFLLCCYSEIRADLEGIGYHIEHIKPKSQYPKSTFDYHNLAASAIHSEKLAQLEDVFGGHAKLSNYDEERFVSCLDSDCASYFKYLSDGRVVPSATLSAPDTDKAEYTIDLLNLNSSFLVNRRRAWWSELDELVQEHLDNDMDLHYLASIDLIPTNNALSPFFSLTRQFFSNVAEEVLKKNHSAL
ncbi:retron system putative HNH endonuclease [Oceanimonas sp. CHS3-5]|uniref:retron system putative HNH endonuclease n=1 Tax=Oceanimonas sp. CHS3-5 TaxID=3068186 RepID=UPI00273D9D8E|nr:retron system putative HNH endonuclease [Oceanimonas sp. CHS3-5]MDP5292455.1 retron system putative HNH endonuclease [Oceanimonas sp. CHS3-5]